MPANTPHTQMVDLEVQRPGDVDHDRAKREAKSMVKSYKPYEVTTPYTGGNVKALLIGINYVGSQSELSGCCNDVKTMLNMLQKIEFPIEEAAFLVDDPSVATVVDLPTRGNMIRYMAWLTDGAKAGDVLFLHYSGHGAQTKARKDDDEEYDQCLVPVNYLSDGTILDNDLFIELVKDLPAGVRMTVVFDCCHSASMLDLPFQFVGSGKVSGDGDYTMKQVRQDNFSAGDVLLFSGCADDGTSADVTSSAGAGGAATAAFTWCVENEHGADYLEVLVKTREALVDKGFTQVPQLSCSKPLDLNKPFSLFGDLTIDEEQAKAQVPEEVQKKWQRPDGGHKCDESKIPPRFRHPLMAGFDEGEVRKCFGHSHFRRDRMHARRHHRFHKGGGEGEPTAGPATSAVAPLEHTGLPHPPKLPVSPPSGPSRKPSKQSPTSVTSSAGSHALTNSTNASPGPTTLPSPGRTPSKPTTNATIRPPTSASTASSMSAVPALPSGNIPKPRLPSNVVVRPSPLVPPPTPSAPVSPAATKPMPAQRPSQASSVPPLPAISPQKPNTKRASTTTTTTTKMPTGATMYPAEETRAPTAPAQTKKQGKPLASVMPDMPKKLFAIDETWTVHKFLRSIYGQIELELGNVNAHLVIGTGQNGIEGWMTLKQLYDRCRDAQDGMLYVRYARTVPSGAGIATGRFQSEKDLATRKRTATSGRSTGKVPVVVEALTAY